MGGGYWGLGQITWRIVLTKKIRGHSGKEIARKSRNSWRLSGKVWEHTDSWLKAQIDAIIEPNTNAQRMSLLSSVALTFARLITQLLQLPAQSLIGSPKSLFGTNFAAEWGQIRKNWTFETSRFELLWVVRPTKHESAHPHCRGAAHAKVPETRTDGTWLSCLSEPLRSWAREDHAGPAEATGLGSHGKLKVLRNNLKIFCHPI